MKKRISLIVGICVAVVFLLECFYYVPAGSRGVRITLGKVGEKVVPNGVGFKAPFISRVKQMNVRTIKISQISTTYTKDVQTADVEYEFSYNLNENTVNQLYEKVGPNYEQSVVIPALVDASKDVIGKWEAQAFIPNREIAKEQILEILHEKLDHYGYYTNFVLQIKNCDYSDGFEQAIENKVKAEQKALEAKNNTIRIEEEAKQTVLQAEAEAKAMQIKADALAKNKSLVEYEAVQKWNGTLPTYMLGDSMPFIQLK